MRSDATVILAFDTSAAHCAAVLLSGDAVLAARDEAMARGQAERLMPMLAEMLAEAGRGWSDLGRLAVCTGPGNFTGCRIGVAAARGLAFGLGIPAVGVTVFEALAAAHAGPVLACAADRRGGFVQLWSDGAPLGPPVGDRAALPRIPDGSVVVGAGAEAIAAEFGLVAGPSSVRADPVAIARAAARRDGPQPPPAPLYLRAADARPAAGPLPVLLDDA